MNRFEFKKKQIVLDEKIIYMYVEKGSNTDCKCTDGGTVNAACPPIKVVK